MADDLDLAPEGEIDDIGAQLQAAFDVANADDLGTGDQPPPPDVGTAPVTEPAEKPASTAAERARDERGRFAPGDVEKPPGEPVKPEATAPKPGAAAAAAPVDPNAPPKDGELRPPGGWSPTSKAAFATLPDAVKQDIAKRETEVNQGLAKLQQFKELEPLANYAKQRNATPAQYFGMLANAEARLERDPSEFVATVMRDFKVQPLDIVRRLGISPEYLVNMARHMGGAPPQQQGQEQPQSAPQDARTQQMMQQLWNEAQQAKRDAAEAKQAIDQIRMEPVQRQARDFLNDPKYPFAQNVVEDMKDLLQRGKAQSYEQAYEIAVWSNPETRPLLIKQQREDEGKAAAERARTAASNARTGARSVTGSPPIGASNAPDLSDLSLEDQLRSAYRGAVA